LAQRLIELHGGKLNVESVPGQGTTVTVSSRPSACSAGAHVEQHLAAAFHVGHGVLDGR
jgi:hypothetical protein